MTDTRIILAESSDIMLDGITDMIKENSYIYIVGKAIKYNHLCALIEQLDHDLVVLGPMIIEKFGHQLMGYLLNKFPFIKIAQINLDDDKEIIFQKIQKVALSQEV